MFVKSFLGSGAVTAFNALRAFAINKLLAVFLPPAAFACVGQFMNLLTIGRLLPVLLFRMAGLA